jgi:hypothetical protein
MGSQDEKMGVTVRKAKDIIKDCTPNVIASQNSRI